MLQYSQNWIVFFLILTVYACNSTSPHVFCCVYVRHFEMTTASTLSRFQWESIISWLNSKQTLIKLWKYCEIYLWWQNLWINFHLDGIERNSEHVIHALIHNRNRMHVAMTWGQIKYDCAFQINYCWTKWAKMLK